MKLFVDHELPKNYLDELSGIKKYPINRGIIAAKRFLLIKESEQFIESERNEKEDKFRKKVALKKFCDNNSLSIDSFYRNLRNYRERGIKGLVPRIGIPALGDRFSSDILDTGIERFDWIRVVDKKAFNLALYKYCMVQPLLNPDLTSTARGRLVRDLAKRFHYPPLSEKAMTFSRGSIYRYLSHVKEKGFDGLIHKFAFIKVRRHKNIIRVNLDIDLRDPIDSIRKIKEIVENAPEVKPGTKAVALRILNQLYELTKSRKNRYSPVSIKRILDQDELANLMAFAESTHRHTRARAKAVLMTIEGRSLMEIVLETRRSPNTIYRWIRFFNKSGVDFIETTPDFTKHNEEKRERTNRIIKILHRTPNDYGFNRTSWIYRDIATVYEKEYNHKLSHSVIRKSIKETNYSLKRARKVLSSPDSKYEEKVKAVLIALRGMGENDAFFFIDEAGPWAVKKYGGKSFTEKGTVKTFPQYQKIRGKITFIGALDAIKNQLTWFFTKSKDTGAVVCLITILFFKYREYSNLYMTWDCASWHKSKGVNATIERLNEAEYGPTVKIVPLPKSAQFLNVIEAVFSGTKRAVIHNSDYESEFDMKMALHRHFLERNEYFRKNPKCAGNKIWDKEYYDLDKLESGLFKKV